MTHPNQTGASHGRLVPMPARAAAAVGKTAQQDPDAQQDQRIHSQWDKENRVFDRRVASNEKYAQQSPVALCQVVVLRRFQDHAGAVGQTKNKARQQRKAGLSRHAEPTHVGFDPARQPFEDTRHLEDFNHRHQRDDNHDQKHNRPHQAIRCVDDDGCDPTDRGSKKAPVAFRCGHSLSQPIVLDLCLGQGRHRRAAWGEAVAPTIPNATLTMIAATIAKPTRYAITPQ